MKGIFVTKIIAALAGVSVAATVALGTTSSAHASLPAPTEAVTATAMQAAPPAESVFKQFKWPTLEKGESGEIGVRFKPRGGSTLPTGKGIEAVIEAPRGTTFEDPRVRLRNERGDETVIEGSIFDGGTSMRFRAADYRISGAFGVQVHFTVHAAAPTDGLHWGKISITGGGALLSTSSSYKYKGVTPAATPFSITSPEEGSSHPYDSVAFEGYGTPGAQVRVRDADGTDIGSSVVDAEGVWIVHDAQNVLVPGNNTAIASQFVKSEEEQSVSFEVENPKLESLTPVAGSTVSRNPEYTGTGTPGDVLDIVLTHDQTAESTTISTVVAKNGRWSAIVKDPLFPGSYSGRLSSRSAPEANVRIGRVNVAAAADTPVTIISPADDLSFNPSGFSFLGYGTPHAAIRLTLEDGTEVGTTTTDARGLWEFGNWKYKFDPGRYRVTVTQKTEHGTSTDARSFTALYAGLPKVTSPAANSIVGLRPEYTGLGPVGDVMELKIIQSGTGTLITTMHALVGPDGTWTATPTEDLPPGHYGGTLRSTASSPMLPVKLPTIWAKATHADE